MKNIEACATLLGVSSEDLKSKLEYGESDRLITYKRACEILSISDATLHRMLNRGQLTRVLVSKHPRIKMSEIDDILSA